MSRVSDAIITLLGMAQDALIQTSVDDRLRAESKLYKQLIAIRNNVDVNDIIGNSMTEGHAISEETGFINNEMKFSKIYTILKHLNEYNVDPIVQSKYDANILKLIAINDNLPMWYDISDEELSASKTPLCRLSTADAYKQRLVKLITNTGADMKNGRVKIDDVYERSDTMTRDIHVDNDLFLPTRKRKITNLAQLKIRFREELDPRYKSHPCEYLLVTLLMIKARHADYFDYGVRFITEFIQHLSIEMSGERIMHLPLEFRSDGSLVRVQYTTLFSFQFRYVLNLLSLKLYNIETWIEHSDHTDVSNEILMNVLQDPMSRGKALKKAFTPIGLYYCMNKDEPPVQLPSVLSQHKHPYYGMTELAANKYPYVFVKHSVCTGNLCSQNLHKSVYSRAVREYIATFDKFANVEGYPLTLAFVKKYLTYYRPNKYATHDIIFIRCHFSASGYSHTHKLADFIPPIEKHVKANDEFVDKYNQGEYALAHSLSDELRQIGYTQTLNLLRNGEYPTGGQFASMLSTFMTARSAGVAPIKLSMEYTDPNTNMTKMLNTSITSKSGYNSLFGDGILQLPEAEKLANLQRYYENLSSSEQLRVMTKGLDASDLAANNVSTIGSRATSGFRDIRAIFMMKLPLHIAQCAIVYPHVDVTTRRYKDDDPPNDLWINEHDYGRGILTTDQDGSDDVWARYIMASGDGNFLILATDASAWDQNVKTPFMTAFMEGVANAIKESEHIYNEIYMYRNGAGLKLTDIIHTFNEVQKSSLYCATYGYESRIVRVNFLTSGRLDTFMTNSIINMSINKLISREMSQYGTDLGKYVAVTVAGDDVISLLDLTKPTAANVEKTKVISTSIYDECGQITNMQKTVAAVNNGEVAKRNIYNGMGFRDPNIQVFESEKSDRVDSKITRIRGQASKLFECLRRSVSDVELSTLHARLIVMLTYNYKTMSKASADSQSKSTYIKYYPPFSASVIPTHVAGGVGMTMTGVSINEALFLIHNKVSCVDEAMGIVSLLKNSSNEKLQVGFLAQFVDKSKLGVVRGAERGYDVKSVKFENTIPGDVQPSILNGMSHKRATLKNVKTTESQEAITRLARSGFMVPESAKYQNSPELMLRDFSETLSAKAAANSMDIDSLMVDLFEVADGKLRFKEVKKHLTLKTMYPIYQMMHSRFKYDDAQVQESNMYTERITSQSSIMASCERFFGSRHGKSVKLDFQGANSDIRRFIVRTGLSMTSQQLMDHLQSSGILSGPGAVDKNVQDFLTAVSGDDEASAILVQKLQSESYSWEDMLTALTIAGSSAEQFDWNQHAVDENVSVTAPYTVIPNAISRMVKYNARMLLIQQSVFDRKMYSHVIVNLDETYASVINNMKTKLGKQKSKDSVPSTLLDNIALLYDKATAGSSRVFKLDRDDSSV